MPHPAPKPAHASAPSTAGLPFGKPTRRERVRHGGITVRRARSAATREKRFGPHAELIRACPCAALYPMLYASREAIHTVLLTAAHEVAEAKAVGKEPPRRSAAHHAVKRSHGGLARHLIPVNHPLHDEAELTGNANAFLVEHGCPPPVELAALIWIVKEEIRGELERVERGGGL